MRRMHVLAFAGNNVHPQICTDIKDVAPSWLTGKDGDRLIRWTDDVALSLGSCRCRIITGDN